MDADELRRTWTRFWTDKGHTVVPSGGLIPHHPSAPMFTNSGMMPFVPYFLGEEPVPFDPPRAASIQKCVRAGGKHNDLDAIGRSPRHLSFFEMLGNFSFGDYFKPDAIAWAWELVTEVLGVDADRVWVTVHVSDDEAHEIWADGVGFPAERIQRLDADNFWEMGATGPCGPSSELFFDFGAEHGPDGGPANPEAEHRYVEFWNLVFPQYYRGTDGALSDLPSKNIDTGAGFERMLGVLKGSPSLYAADSVSRMVDAAQSLTGTRLGAGEDSDVALRLLADHARTMTFLIADGVIPSNEERGYVLRRIIRRAVRFAYLIGVEKPIAAPMAEKVAEVLGDAYPEVRTNLDLIWGVLDREEAQFRRTLRIGLRMLEDEMSSLDPGATLSGNLAFTLHDTYGFPYEVTAEIAEDRGHSVDRAAFDADMAEQKRLSKEGGRKNKGVELGDAQATFQRIVAEHGPTVFTGRDEESTQATVLAVVDTDADGLVDIILDRTPFYAESGGQVGDTGTIIRPSGEAEVLDTTYAVPGLHRHRARITSGTLVAGDVVAATIDGERRAAIKRNHTGTHLLHWALHEVLGPHVKQQGSLVAPDRLRFDFSHYEPVTAEQVARIEDLVNEAVLVNDPVRHYETSKDEAMAKGAIAFFGEKYGDRVRVLEAGRHSTELCGGTHVTATGDIGPMKIVSEGSIGSNLRRVEAITGFGPIERIREEEAVLARAADLVGVPVGELIEGIEKRLGEVKALRDEVSALKAKAAAGGASDLAAQAVDGVVVGRVDGLDRDAVRTLALAVRDQPGIRAVVLGAAPEGGGVALVAATTADSGLEAGALIADAAKTVGGGGGKGKDLAVAGGRNPAGLDDALDQARAAAGLSS
ncbi:alanine--tRNA ligase [Iamia sp. SCSIO 61187]|uniref:alanine--tRNA ligase n=1 Tax=Iamia sp. SCSIO 61187 TaxID=2722752 RepID=UPI001C632A18|nr:alanine--tRNA ligase [Iamia sp. SCSIO 61187]QYG93381.1 alanine--tRNA ligase [Iamia sp. SCSIO 61187]